MEQSEEVETRLPDLTGFSLADMTKMREQLSADQEVLLDQVDKPRLNLGTGPPGRVD